MYASNILQYTIFHSFAKKMICVSFHLRMTQFTSQEGHHVFTRVQQSTWLHVRAGTVQAHEAHSAEVNCLGFNPFNEYVLATGSADKTVRQGPNF